MKLIMKYLKNRISLLAVLVLIGFTQCKEEYPLEGSIPDKTLPSANFSYKTITGTWDQVKFTNLSISASDYEWDFGDGATSTEKEPTHTFADEGTYSVSLSASDKNLASSDVTMQVVIVNELVPAFANHSFEQTDTEGKTLWGNNYSTSQSPVPPDGPNGAKLNSTSHLEQTILVKANRKYKISYWYVSKAGGVVAFPLKLTDAANGDVLYSEDVPMSASASVYEEKVFEFSTGSATSITLRIDRGDVEARLDWFVITEVK
jgi:PKD repeat protein